MSTTTISALPAITVPAAADILPIVHAGVTSNITLQSLLTFFGAPGAFTASETLGGIVNGVNLTFTLSYAPIAAFLPLYFNGVYLRPTIDYTVSGNSITLIVGGASSIAFPPSGSDWLAAGPYFH